MSDINIEFCGRLGNTMFQYAVARAYAERYGATLHTPQWLGSQIFDLPNHPRPIRNLESVGFDNIPDGRTNISLAGYFQNQEAVNLFSQSKLREWFKIKPQWHNLIQQTEIAAHIRRGDYLGITHIFCIISEKSYVDACYEVGLNPNSITWVTEEAPRQMPVPPGLEFLPDFLTLMYAKILFRANSTFSWWAGALSTGEVYSPLVENRKGHYDGIKFVKGNWPKLIDIAGQKVGDMHIPP